MDRRKKDQDREKELSDGGEILKKRLHISVGLVFAKMVVG
jgi:hypothetical protein